MIAVSWISYFFGAIYAVMRRDTRVRPDLPLTINPIVLALFLYVPVPPIQTLVATHILLCATLFLSIPKLLFKESRVWIADVLAVAFSLDNPCSRAAALC